MRKKIVLKSGSCKRRKLADLDCGGSSIDAGGVSNEGSGYLEPFVNEEDGLVDEVRRGVVVDDMSVSLKGFDQNLVPANRIDGDSGVRQFYLQSCANLEEGCSQQCRLDASLPLPGVCTTGSLPSSASDGYVNDVVASRLQVEEFLSHSYMNQFGVAGVGGRSGIIGELAFSVSHVGGECGGSSVDVRGGINEGRESLDRVYNCVDRVVCEVKRRVAVGDKSVSVIGSEQNLVAANRIDGDTAVRQFYLQSWANLQEDCSLQSRVDDSLALAGVSSHGAVPLSATNGSVDDVVASRLHVEEFLSKSYENRFDNADVAGVVPIVGADRPAADDGVSLISLGDKDCPIDDAVAIASNSSAETVAIFDANLVSVGLCGELCSGDVVSEQFECASHVAGDSSVGVCVSKRLEVEHFLDASYSNQSSLPCSTSNNVVNRHSQEDVFSEAKIDFSNGVPQKVHRNPTSIFKPNKLIVLPDVPACHHCKARRFFLEPAGFCCCAGDIMLKPVVLPRDIVELLTGSSAMCKHFRTYIRLYNGNFAYTTMGVKKDPGLGSKKQCGIYTFRVSGQIHHFLGDLQPKSVPKPGLELYFYDPQHELQNRLNTCESLNKDVMGKLMRALDKNPYAAFLRSLHQVVDLDRYYISINCSSSIDQRTHNSPTSSDVAAIWLDDDTSGGSERFQRDIRVYGNSGRSFAVREHYSCFDTLSYPLMFPRGEQGWHPNILKVAKDPKGGTRQSPGEVDVNCRANIVDLTDEGEFNDMELGPTVSARQYYCYKLQMRPDDKSFQLSFGRLLQQFVVDMYIKIETMRLVYIRCNQSKFRVDFYQGVVDSIALGFAQGRKVGKRILLPASFIGGPRNMQKRYVDAMTLVRRFGKPDIFLTMTCNAKWPEMKSLVKGYEERMNRPDLSARVFRAKVELMKKRITSDCVFGEVASLVYVIEYQKRGLPHAHFLIILKEGFKLLTPEAYDAVVCAEIPNKAADPELHAAVARNMFHGPCGVLGPKNSCMKNGVCKNKYPKEFCQYTTHGEQTYPQYRRREIHRSQFVKVDKHFLDNRWVVPYNPRLLREFNCHMNVEVCCDIRAVKYLYKYVYKGVDKVSMKVQSEESDAVEDEISNFQSARWISPPEAIWRIYAFSLSGMSPSVILLQVHLPDFHSVRFSEDDNLEEIVKNNRSSRTMLTEFFKVNSTSEDPIVGELCYKDFPDHFVWYVGRKVWSRRQRGQVVGRLASVNPAEGERYYLRLLLSNVKSPRSFEDLRTVHGVLCDSFRDAAHLRGLLMSDSSFEVTMEEAAVSQMPSSLRLLFVTMLYYCELASPKVLYKKFFEDLTEDFRKKYENEAVSESFVEKLLLTELDRMLETFGKNINDYALGGLPISRDPHEVLTREMQAEYSVPIPPEDLAAVDNLNVQQLEIYDRVMDDVLSGRHVVYFVDGPGGTGKTYLYKALLARVRALGHVAIAAASSGIAATLLPGGRTAHSRFGIPVDLSDEPQSSLKKSTSAGLILIEAKLIVWDEAPMVHKKVIQCVDKMLKDFCECKLDFGGKVMVLGGDFRQTLPIIPGGTRAEIVGATLVKLTNWQNFQIYRLTDNMRARIDRDFCDFLMRVGDGVEPQTPCGRIRIPKSMLIPYVNEAESLELLIAEVYPDLSLFAIEPEKMCLRAILTPKNESVHEINELLVRKFPGELKIYRSIDTAMNRRDQSHYADFINGQNPSGMPRHELALKVNCPVVLLRNINPLIGFANGTRLICKSLKEHVIGVEIVSGQFKGNHGFIPRIKLAPREGEKYIIPFTRNQFPLRLALAMTINKSQGQTLDFVGVFLRQPVFGHGQLYVALSRARASASVKVLIGPPTEREASSDLTRNEVYQEVLQAVAVHLEV